MHSPYLFDQFFSVQSLVKPPAYWQEMQAKTWAPYYPTIAELLSDTRGSLYLYKKVDVLFTICFYFALTVIFIGQMDLVFYYWYGGSPTPISPTKTIFELVNSDDKQKFATFLSSHLNDAEKDKGLCFFCQNPLQRDVSVKHSISSKGCKLRNILPGVFMRWICFCRFFKGDFCSLHCRDAFHQIRPNYTRPLILRFLREKNPGKRGILESAALDKDKEYETLQIRTKKEAEELAVRNKIKGFIESSGQRMVEVVRKRSTSKRMFNCCRATVRWFFLIVFFLFVSLLLTYFTVIALWWILGSVLNSERVLPLASSTVTFFTYVLARAKTLLSIRRLFVKELKMIVLEQLLEKKLRSDTSNSKHVADAGAEQNNAKFLVSQRRYEAKLQELFMRMTSSPRAPHKITQRDFEKIFQLIGLQLTKTRLMQIFSRGRPDLQDGEFVLGLDEFITAFDSLQEEIGEQTLAAIHLSKNRIRLSIFGGSFLLLCVLVFVYLGTYSFTGGDSFGAAVQSIIPLAAGVGAWKANGDSEKRSLNLTKTVRKTLKKMMKIADEI